MKSSRKFVMDADRRLLKGVKQNIAISTGEYYHQGVTNPLGFPFKLQSEANFTERKFGVRDICGKQCPDWCKARHHSVRGEYYRQGVTNPSGFPFKLQSEANVTWPGL